MNCRRKFFCTLFVPRDDFLIDISSYRDKKNAALRAHRTQYPGLKKLFGDDSTTALEAFRVAWGSRPRTIPAADLFIE
jgi:LmbE family N-acetylglucosaminyl deacetylase